MPFTSKRQERWAFATKQPFAKKWAEHTPSQKALPEQAKKVPKKAGKRR